MRLTNRSSNLVVVSMWILTRYSLNFWINYTIKYRFKSCISIIPVLDLIWKALTVTTSGTLPIRIQIQSDNFYQYRLLITELVY